MNHGSGQACGLGSGYARWQVVIAVGTLSTDLKCLVVGEGLTGINAEVHGAQHGGEYQTVGRRGTLVFHDITGIEQDPQGLPVAFGSGGQKG